MFVARKKSFPLEEQPARKTVGLLFGVATFAEEGGFITYGIDRLDPYRRAASYVDRILKGSVGLSPYHPRCVSVSHALTQLTHGMTQMTQEELTHAHEEHAASTLEPDFRPFLPTE